jgi:uncharacterized Fe-S cluster-containing radical SAM superfamily protein
LKEYGNWIENPLPIEPAKAALGLDNSDEIESQVFQIAGCNWRCWYCFVPFDLLAAKIEHSAWLSVPEMIDLFCAEPKRPKMIDLSGGQPDLVPEWIIWTMEELKSRGLEKDIFLWSDDNLSTDFFWKYLSDKEIRSILEYKNYSKVGCFKGICEDSFAFNTKAGGDGFLNQIELFKRFVNSGFDMYAYLTLTMQNTDNLNGRMERFMDMLQSVDKNLPLRTVPLMVAGFGTVQNRFTNRVSELETHLDSQFAGIKAWNTEIEKRFTAEERKCLITEVKIRG